MDENSEASSTVFKKARNSWANWFLHTVAKRMNREGLSTRTSFRSVSGRGDTLNRPPSFPHILKICHLFSVSGKFRGMVIHSTLLAFYYSCGEKNPRKTWCNVTRRENVFGEFNILSVAIGVYIALRSQRIYYCLDVNIAFLCVVLLWLS